MFTRKEFDIEALDITGEPNRTGAEHANALEALWRDSEQRRTAQLHKENRALWYVHFCRMAESHRKLSEDYEARAEALCQEGAA